MPIAGLDHVLVAAPPGCEREARHFYGGLLGLPEIPKPESLGRPGVWFAAGAQQLHVGAYDDFEPVRRGHPAFSVSDEPALAEIAERLEHAGANVRWDDRLEGIPRFYTEDPWGNRVELIVGGAPAPGQHAQRPEG
jgi:catechol 2,3-dioxygenase-like lactoylglutathione lyase family enzyme